MITFIAICAVMAVAAVVLIVRPLLRKPTDSAPRDSSRASALAVALLVPVVAAGVYIKQSNWSWQQAETTATQQATVQQMVTQLEQRLQSSPEDMQGWLMLGRSYMALDQPARAVGAYQQAFDLSKGDNTEAIVGLAEALVVTDEATLRGRAGQLFELALSREPGNPAALWYGAIAALASGKLEVGRQRIANLLAQNPPQQVKDILERQLQDIDEQLGQTGGPSAPVAEGTLPAKADASGRKINVRVSLAPALANKADPRTTLFILARGEGGPPLAVIRRAVDDLPLSVTLSDADAMIAGRNLSSVKSAHIVARISKGGTPQAQSGDLFGEITYAFNSSSSATVDIVIDRVVP